MVSVADLDRWVADAQRALLLAQKICSGAEAKLNAIECALSRRLPRKIEYAVAIFGATKEHQRRGVAVVEKCSEKVRQAKSGVRDTAAMATLGLITSQLRATKVPDYILNHSVVAPLQQHTLADFIAAELIEVLQRHCGGYHSNHGKITRLMEREFESVAAAAAKQTKEYNRVVKLYNDCMYEVGNPQGKAAARQILKENAALGAELAAILQLLTNHYDQCQRATKAGSGSGAQFTQQDWDILANDALELAEVSHDLEGMHAIILRNELRARELTNAKVGAIATLETEVERQIERYKDFKHHALTRFETIYAALHARQQQEQQQIDECLASADQLIYHYRTFYNVYRTKLFGELHYERFVYPRMFMAKLKKFLHEDLDRTVQLEKDRRQKWLAKYADFIPKEIDLPGEADQPAIIQIVTQGLDDREEDPEVERGILDFIAKSEAEGRGVQA